MAHLTATNIADTNSKRDKSLFLTTALLLAMPTVVRATDTDVPPSDASSQVDAIQQRGTLRVAVFNEYPRLVQVTDGGSTPFAGPAWRLAEEYAKRLTVKIETIPVISANKVTILSGGQVDISIAPLLETPERDKAVDFILYSTSAQCLIGLADNLKLAQAATIDDLNRSDITVAYVTGSPQEPWLQRRLSEAAQRGVPGNIVDVPLGEIRSHRADVVSIDKFFVAGLMKKMPGLVSVPKGDACLASQELPAPIGMTISKDQPAFLAWLRAVADAVKPQVDAEEARVEKAGS